MSKYMSQNFKSIILKAAASVVNKEAQIDLTDGAAGIVTPGYLVTLTADNPTSLDRDVVKPHAVAGGFAEAAFLLEDELQGKGVYQDDPSLYGAPPSADLAEFAAGEIAQYRRFQPGDQILAVMHQVFGGTAADTDITKGDPLTSAGDGTLRLADPATEHVVARALESVTLPVPGAGDDFCYIPVEIA